MCCVKVNSSKQKHQLTCSTTRASYMYTRTYIPAVNVGGGGRDGVIGANVCWPPAISTYKQIEIHKSSYYG